MDSQDQFCHNPTCWAYGRAVEGHIVIHSQRERRYQCRRCDKTFSATAGTARYRAHKPVAVVVQVVTLLAHGCPRRRSSRPSAGTSARWRCAGSFPRPRRFLALKPPYGKIRGTGE